MSDLQGPESLLEFPCHYQFKAVGAAGADFLSAVVVAVSNTVSVPDDAVKSRPSGKGNYQSVSVMVTLHNFEQLTRVYADLRQVTGMRMLL